MTKQIGIYTWKSMVGEEVISVCVGTSHYRFAHHYRPPSSIKTIVGVQTKPVLGGLMFPPLEKHRPTICITRLWDWEFNDGDD